jgi:ribosomal-protein-alanine N-acetyltransferase
MAPLELEVKIREVKEEDLDKIVEIENLSFKDPWSRFSFSAELRNPFSKIYVAAVGNNLVGYIILWEFSELLHIANIAVHPDFRRRGIGGKLLEKAIFYAKELGVGGITLEVRASNGVAQRFYEKNGFRKMGNIRYYYKDGEDAFIYRRDIK